MKSFLHNLHNKNKGFTLVEIAVVIAVMVVLLAVLAPALLRYVEDSRAQKDESAMDEVVNAIQLSLADATIFDEAYAHHILNNYTTYTDSSGVYGAKYTDEEFWAPDGAGKGVTITFNPDEQGNYHFDTGFVNDMTFGNGSVAEPRTANGNLIQCYFKDMGEAKLYSSLKQSMGETFVSKSNTYKNSSYTVFILFNSVDTMQKVTVYGEFNGTNLSDDCPAAIVTNTESYTPESQPDVERTASKGTASFTSSDLSGGGSSSTNSSDSDYRQCSHRFKADDTNSLLHVCSRCYSKEAHKYTNNVCSICGSSEVELPKLLAKDDWYSDTTSKTSIKTIILQDEYTPSGSETDSWSAGEGVTCYVVGETLHVAGNGAGGIRISNCENMFKDFSNLETIQGLDLLDTSTVTDMDSMFENCATLTSLDIQNLNMKNTRTAYKQFYNCSRLAEIKLPNAAPLVGGYAFGKCTSLRSVVIPKTVSSIGAQAFNGCSNLESVNIPKGVTSIGDWTFYGCKLNSIEIPNTVTSVGIHAFQGTNLTEVTIPKSLTTIKGEAFFCPKLQTIHVDSRNPVFKEVNGALLSHDGKTLEIYPAARTTLDIPDTIETIRSYALRGCRMTSATFPEGLTRLEQLSFYWFNVSTIYLPGSIEFIGDRAFQSCQARNIYFDGTLEQWADIEKSNGWNTNARAECVLHCSDGDVLLTEAI